MVYLLGIFPTFLGGGTQQKGEETYPHDYERDFMKEVACGLDSMGHSYMKMEVWVVGGMSGKKANEQKTPQL